jgi:uncharacterized membrane protein
MQRRIKMNKFKVLKRNNLPTKLPFLSTALIITLLDYWDAPEWLWGVMCFLLIITWIVCIYEVITQKEIDLLNNKEKRE